VLEVDYPQDKIEIIAINDGSKDDTWQWIMKAAENSNNRIRPINLEKNGGKKAALCRAIRESKNPIIITVDSDSLLEKNSFRNLVSPFADENIGAMIQELKRLGLYDNTVIVVLGDHGYHTGEQGIWCKSTNYEAACHSPLIIKDAYQKKASSVSVPVEFVDIFPTLTYMCGVEAPAELSGKNLNDLDSKKEYYAFSQFPRPYAALHRVSARTHMGYTVRDSRWRYVQWYDNSGNLVETELYDMQDSMLEKENLSGQEACADVEVRLTSALAKLSKNANFTAK
jgi:arylsulfatase A-like enzyme